MKAKRPYYMSNFHHVAYIGIINYKEIYYSTASQKFRAYKTDILSGTTEEIKSKKSLMDFAQQTLPAFGPLVVMLFYLCMRDRTTGMPAIHTELPSLVYYAMAAFVGLLPAIKIKRAVTRVWENHYMDGEDATEAEKEQAVKELRKSNRLYAFLRILLIMGAAMLPIVEPQNGQVNVFILLGYACIWFTLYIMYAFRPFTCWSAELQLRENKRKEIRK